VVFGGHIIPCPSKAGNRANLQEGLAPEDSEGIYAKNRRGILEVAPQASLTACDGRCRRLSKEWWRNPGPFLSSLAISGNTFRIGGTHGIHHRRGYLLRRYVLRSSAGHEVKTTDTHHWLPTSRFPLYKWKAWNRKVTLRKRHVLIHALWGNMTLCEMALALLQEFGPTDSRYLTEDPAYTALIRYLEGAVR